MRVMIERIKEAQPQTHLTSTFLGCLTAMTNGDVTAITGEHWGNAFRSGGITAVVATVAVGLVFVLISGRGLCCVVLLRLVWR